MLARGHVEAKGKVKWGNGEKAEDLGVKNDRVRKTGGRCAG